MFCPSNLDKLNTYYGMFAATARTQVTGIKLFPKRHAKETGNIDMGTKNKIPVLVVDDHAGFRRSVIHFLASNARFQVVGEAANTREGLDLAARHHPQVVLLDIRMPEESGLAIIAKLRQRVPNLVIIVLTLWDTAEYREAALVDNGADAYITKENMIRDLLPALNRLLPETSNGTSIAN